MVERSIAVSFCISLAQTGTMVYFLHAYMMIQVRESGVVCVEVTMHLVHVLMGV